MSAGTSHRNQFCASTITEIALSILCVAYISGSAIWMLYGPQSKVVGMDPKSGIPAPMQNFWLFWGLEQNWKLFSPVIRDINFHPVGIITFQDGFKEVWEPPRMDKLD